jgi:hypothetical protein
VCVYLVSPDGDGFDSLIVSEACEEERLAKMLASAAERYKVPAGKPLVAPRSQSAAPKAKPGEVVLHRVAHRPSL